MSDEKSEYGPGIKRGPIAWMAKNTVAANLLMGVLLIGGAVVGTRVKQEVFPEFQMDTVIISVPYPGASPEEVEEAILLVVEEAVRGVDGIEEVNSTASEGFGTVAAEIILGEDIQKVVADVKNAVDRIQTFPADAERPTISLMSNRREVMSLAVYGDQDEHVLREVATRVRDGLLQSDDITLVELNAVRQPEISVEVPQAALRSYGLTLEQIAQRIRGSAVDLPGGGIKTPGGEILLRMSERRDRGREFEDITVVSAAAGTDVRLGDIAHIEDGFADTDDAAFFDGVPAAGVDVYRVGDETPLSVAAAVQEFLEKNESSLPPGIGIAVLSDWSDIYRQRLELLVRNAELGLIFVLVILGLFLDIRLSFWVTLGIPISFLGSLLFLPGLNASLNMLSLFAFIVTLGMVVDDAIVVGENVYEYRQRGYSRFRAAVEGTREVAGPVIFAVLTTLAAFAPMLFVPGFAGKIFGVVPVIVITVLMLSLVESLLVLPAHLGHKREIAPRGPLGLVVAMFRGVTAPFFWVAEHARRIASGILAWVIERTYKPSVAFAIRYRYFSLAVALAIATAAFGYVRSGRLGFSFMPKIESDRVMATAELPYGSPVQDTEAVMRRIVAAADEVIDELGGDSISKGVFARVGGTMASGPNGVSTSGGHITSVRVRLVPAGERDFTAAEFVKRWREKTGAVAGVRSMTFKFQIGPSAGADIDIQLSHHDVPTLERAATEVAAALRNYEGVKDVDEGFSPGKRQLDFKVSDSARTLGLTASEIGRQVRSAFYGAEAIRQQRGRDELRVMVRLPDDERHSEHDIEELLVRTPRGGEVPVVAAAEVDRGRAYTSIRRHDGRRVVSVTAETIEGKADPGKVIASMAKSNLPEVMKKYPGLSWTVEGAQKEMAESMGSLMGNFVVALLIIYALLAIPFRSYFQPFVVMSAIPFGFVGALIGHVLMGFGLSLISMMGVVALAGVVVNDSLVLVVAANDFRDGGRPPDVAVRDAGVRRFRPILLTSLTTFLGLAPMIFETSVQARFLIPMAISLGYGVLFATFITLMLVPALYMIVEDLKALVGARDDSYGAPAPAPPAADETAVLASTE